MRLETAQPVDLLLAAGLLVVADLAVVLDFPAVLRVPLALLLLLVLPGYAFVAALFPEQPDPQAAASEGRGWRTSVSGLERTALTLATSVAFVALVGLLLNYAATVTLRTTTHGMAIMSAFLIVVAAVRRLLAPPERRYRPALLLPSIPADWGRAERVLAVALALAIVFAGGSAAYVILQPRQPVHFTELYLLGSDGRPACYPATHLNGSYQHREGEACSGAAGLVTLGLANHEAGRRTYHVRAVWSNETVAGNQTSVHTVLEWLQWTVTLEPVPVAREPTAPHEPQYERPLTVPPPPGNGTWRLSFQVYLDSPPALRATTSFLETPYRRVHLWITG